MSDYIKRDIERIIANAQECDIDALTWEEQKERLEAVKSADVAPVRHGRWKEKQPIEHYHMGESIAVRYNYACSECGFIEPRRHNYCPNCGAKMDEEDEQ